MRDFLLWQRRRGSSSGSIGAAVAASTVAHWHINAVASGIAA